MRTPASTARPRTLRFAFASCQDYQAGFYTAYQHLAAEDLAFVAFLGDYIYEGPANPAAARQHEGTGEGLRVEFRGIRPGRQTATDEDGERTTPLP